MLIGPAIASMLLRAIAFILIPLGALLGFLALSRLMGWQDHEPDAAIAIAAAVSIGLGLVALWLAKRFRAMMR